MQNLSYCVVDYNLCSKSVGVSRCTKINPRALMTPLL